MSIEKSSKRRGIKFLLHFTRIENVRSILQHGLLSKSQFAQRVITAVINDELRLDGFPEATSISIGFPNYKMFYSIRQRDRSVRWAVLAINPSVLWTKDCAFCVENAASGAVTSIPIRARKTLAAFEQMFNDIPGKPDRDALKIPEDVPTNPQAEVLVFDPIEPELIVGIAFNGSDLVEQYKADAVGRQVKLIPGLFGPRVDFSHWK